MSLHAVEENHDKVEPINQFLSHLGALQVRYLLVGEDGLGQRRVEAPGDARALAGLVQERHLHAVDDERGLRTG